MTDMLNLTFEHYHSFKYFSNFLQTTKKSLNKKNSKFKKCFKVDHLFGFLLKKRVKKLGLKLRLLDLMKTFVGPFFASLCKNWRTLKNWLKNTENFQCKPGKILSLEKRKCH